MSPRNLRRLIIGIAVAIAIGAIIFPFRGSRAAFTPQKKTNPPVEEISIAESTHRKLANFDAFAVTNKRSTSGISRSAAKTSGQPQLEGGRPVQLESRLGVPTFLWASDPGKARQVSTASAALAKRDTEAIAREHLLRYSSHYRLSADDVAQAKLVSIHNTGKGAIVAKFHQEFGGIEVFRDELNVIMNRNFQVVALSGYLTGDNTEGEGVADGFTVQPVDAVSRALADLTGTAPVASSLRAVATTPGSDDGYLKVKATKGANNFSFADEPARVKKVIFHLVDQYVPAWYVEAHVVMSSTEGAPDDLAYSYVVSAVDGSILFRNNLVAQDTNYTYRVWVDPVTKIPFDTPVGNGQDPKINPVPDGVQFPFLPQNDITLANFPFSKNDPWLPSGSTETVGNNADAFVDVTSPDGYGPIAAAPYDNTSGTGDFRAQLTGPNAFLHTHTPDLNPATAEARQGGIQQLFYDVNFLHDWYYDAGFDEASGNAQTDNFGRGGLGNDSIKAQAQDFAARNNANMLTPADGARPRMRMYVFDSNAPKYLDVLSPANIAGQRAVGTGQFGAQVFDMTNEIVAAAPINGCTAFTNAAAVAGKLVLVDRDPTASCSIGTKLNAAMAAGAAGFILVNSQATPDTLVNVTGSLPTFTIPFVSITWNGAVGIKSELAALHTVTARLRRDTGIDRDGTIDNQIVFHEWGHYISNRLIGNGNGLNTNYAGGLGEGWGDFNAMLLTVRAEDALVPGNSNWAGIYPLATYATSGGENNGYYFGIRRVPYSIDFTKNPLTFKHISNGVALPGGVPIAFGQDGAQNAEVHNTGEVWASMLWECYASLLNDSGRLTFQEAQDRMKRYIVVAYKMTPSNPTLLDARDAVLAAAYASDPVDGKLFADAFARRGAGLGAISPDRFSADNIGVTESFVTGSAASFVSASLTDNVHSCDNDGYLDANETGTLTVNIKNTGYTALSGTTATVTSGQSGILFPAGTTITFPASQPFETVSGTLQVGVSAVVGTLDGNFTITINDPDITTQVAQFHEYVNVNVILAASSTDTVEARQTPWTTGNNPTFGTPAGSQWQRVQNGGINHDWYAPDWAAGNDQYLISPVFTVDGSGSTNLQFDHSWSFEFDGGGNYDGGVIEMSVNGGAYTDIGASAYNGTILNYSGDVNPLKGRPGFVQNSGGFVHTSLTKAIAPGSTIQYRFRIASDGGVGAPGWHVDNIAFTGVVETPFGVLVAGAGTCCPLIQVSPGTLPQGAVNVPYTTTLLTPVGGTAPFSYAINPFVLPNGLVSNIVGGNLQISGTPTASGSFPWRVTITDANGCTGVVNFTIVINKQPQTISFGTLADKHAGDPAFPVSATSSSGLPVSFSVFSGPATIATNMVTVTGIGHVVIRATQTGNAQFAAAPPVDQGFEVTCGSVAIAPATLPNGAVGSAYNNPLSGSGGTGPYTFSVTSGTVPSGLTLNSNGTWSGTLTATGTFNFTVTANGTGQTCPGTKAYTVIVGTAVNSGNILINEFRFRGTGGTEDEFVELYNNTDNDVLVASIDSSAGWALVAADGQTRFIIQNGTVIPKRGHFLAVNTDGYSLSASATGNSVLLPDGTTLAAGYNADIPDGSGVALFKTADPAGFLLANRLDAAGYAGAGSLYTEGTGFPTGGAETTQNLEYSFVRNLVSGTPQDTDKNTLDFISVDTSGTLTGLGQLLGTPSPENLASPGNRTNWAMLTPGFIDPCTAATAAPNRVRSLTSYTDSLSGTGTYSLGTFAIRRRYTNTSANMAVTRLRFRIVDMTSFPAPVGASDLRAISSSDALVSTTVCGGSNLTVKGLTLEQPPAQVNGGGINSTLSAGTITLATPLNPGASIDVQFLLGVQQIGSFRFVVIVEALP